MVPVSRTGTHRAVQRARNEDVYVNYQATPEYWQEMFRRAMGTVNELRQVIQDQRTVIQVLRGEEQ